MHEYDITLKSVLSRLRGSVLEQLTGYAIGTWHNVELPDVRNLRVDMLGETASGELVHIELQSGNDPCMPLRMAEYALAIFRNFGRFPRQVVVYAGTSPLRMPNGIDSECISTHYRVADIREMDAEPMLASAELDDNVLAILMRLNDSRAAVRQVLRRIAEASEADRAKAFKELAMLAGLRSLGAIIKEESRNMPILDDIMDHDLFGPAIRQGMEAGRREGLQEGRQEGRQEGLRHLRDALERLSARRFGPLPEWARLRIENSSSADLDRFASRVLDARTIDDLLS